MVFEKCLKTICLAVLITILFQFTDFVSFIVKFVVSGCAFCIFWIFLFRQSSQRTSQETHIYLHEFKRSWFVIRDWWISIRFVCFVFQGSLLCDRPVQGNNRLVKFALQIFMIFLILVTCKNKATSASFCRQKIHSPS